MKNILIVDDEPEKKIRDTIKFLERCDLEFKYTIAKSIISAYDYLDKRPLEKIDLAILDLGIPYRDNGMVVQPTAGLEIVDEILIESKKTPVIINSSTKLPEAILNRYRRKGLNIFQVLKIRDANQWILDFLQKEHSI